MASEAGLKALKKIKHDLQYDHLVRLCIGAGKAQTTLTVSAALLKNTSPPLAAIADGLLMPAPGSPAGTWILPNDNADAWKVLLHWRLKGRLPPINNGKEDSDELLELLVACWLLGERYKVVAFQDLIMLELLDILTRWTPDMSDVVQPAFTGTQQKSKLWMLMAEEMAYIMSSQEKGYVDVDGLEACPGAKDFAWEVLRQMVVVDEDYCTARLRKRESWKKYMVGGGPEKHWVLRHGEDQEE